MQACPRTRHWQALQLRRSLNVFTALPAAGHLARCALARARKTALATDTGSRSRRSSWRRCWWRCRPRCRLAAPHDARPHLASLGKSFRSLQLLTPDDVETQRPLQSAVPPGQLHAPLLQVCPSEHLRPHWPQEGLTVSTHCPLQEVWWGMHIRLRHIWPEAQRIPQSPQLKGSMSRGTQRPLHRAEPGEQAQVPPAQDIPGAQVRPQAPQLKGSALVSAQDAARHPRRGAGAVTHAR